VIVSVPSFHSDGKKKRRERKDQAKLSEAISHGLRIALCLYGFHQQRSIRNITYHPAPVFLFCAVVLLLPVRPFQRSVPIHSFLADWLLSFHTKRLPTSTCRRRPLHRRHQENDHIHLCPCTSTFHFSVVLRPITRTINAYQFVLTCPQSTSTIHDPRPHSRFVFQVHTLRNTMSRV
jgi:hypothetical protein